MSRWRRTEVGKSWLRHASEDATKIGWKEKGGGEGEEGGRGSHTDTTVDENA